VTQDHQKWSVGQTVGQCLMAQSAQTDYILYHKSMEYIV